jgi:hypothetical protein
MDHTSILKLSYFADVVTENNQLNLSLEENMAKFLTVQEKVASFLSKFQLYGRRVEADDVSMWLELTSKQNCSLADGIIRHLLSVTESISGYIPG